MKFIRAEGAQELISYCVDTLLSHLKNDEKVLFLLPGGSNIASGVSIIRSVPQEYNHLLTLGLTDERYGPIGHMDSNQQQYKDAGLDLTIYDYLPMLFDLPADQTINKVAVSYQQAFKNCSYTLAFMGMGADGHIAGVLPGSIGASTDNFAANYQASDHNRLTLSLVALKQLDEAVLGVFGNKQEALVKLHDQDISVNDQPAQVLKQIRLVSIYNNFIGDNT